LFNQRRTILMADFHERAFHGIPIEFVGINPDMPGVTAAADWADLKRRLGRSRFFVHTAAYPLEDGYNMATVEAMACGLPVLSNRHPTSVVEHGVTGYLSDDPEELRQYARGLLEDRELALRLGKNAREQAASIFSREKFETNLRAVMARTRRVFRPEARGASRNNGPKKALRAARR
jgi:glycosyltransferase involved in cell wall biosynthesis